MSQILPSDSTLLTLLYAMKQRKRVKFALVWQEFTIFSQGYVNSQAVCHPAVHKYFGHPVVREDIIVVHYMDDIMLTGVEEQTLRYPKRLVHVCKRAGNTCVL